MQFCKLADITDWDRPEFQATEALLGLAGRNRKSWEYIHVYEGLKALELLNSQTRALGLGVGSECLVYAFTNVCEQVVATDLYRSKNWSTAAMAVEEVYRENRFPYRPERLVVQHMDMTQIEFPDASFDFVWSCCSIEHVSSFKDLHKVYAEIHRVLKPGGIAALTTEYNLSGPHRYEPHMLFTDPYWITHWLTGENALVQGFDLLDSPNLNMAPVAGNQPLPKRRLDASVPRYSNNIVVNSIAFFLRKAGEFSQPYSDDWLPRFHRTYLAGCERHRQKDWQAAADLFNELIAAPDCEPQLRVAASRYLAVELYEQATNQGSSPASSPEASPDLSKLTQQMLPLWQASEDSDHLMPIAHRCKKLGLWEIAKLLYERIESLPGSSSGHVVRSLIGQAQYYAQANDLPMALKLSQTAHNNLVPRFPKEYPSVYFHRGFYQERLGQLEAAISDYQFVVNASETNPGLLQNAQNRLQKCLDQIEAQKLPAPPASLKAVGRALKGLFR